MGLEPGTSHVSEATILTVLYTMVATFSEVHKYSQIYFFQFIDREDFESASSNLPGFATDKDGRITEAEFWDSWLNSSGNIYQQFDDNGSLKWNL